MQAALPSHSLQQLEHLSQNGSAMATQVYACRCCCCCCAASHAHAVVQYLPNFFFGALLMVFGIEIAGDWLLRSYAKVTRAEYVLLLATFVAIMQLELERGVAAGILMCTIYFAVTYARVSVCRACCFIPCVGGDSNLSGGAIAVLCCYGFVPTTSTVLRWWQLQLCRVNHQHARFWL